MSDVDPTVPQVQPQVAPVAPEQPATPEPAQPTPPAPQEVEQAANQTSILAQPDPEVLLRDFLSGQPVGAHPVIDIQIAPMTIKKMEDGGVVISPSGQLLVKYK